MLTEIQIKEIINNVDTPNIHTDLEIIQQYIFDRKDQVVSIEVPISHHHLWLFNLAKKIAFDFYKNKYKNESN